MTEPNSNLPLRVKTLPDSRPPDQHALLRRMGLFSLIVYGVGDMVGSGIYGTVGKAAGQMGNAVWLAFVVSMVAAMLTGLSYACIASRYPRAAGAAYVTHRAWHVAFLSYVIGLTVTASGLTSMATSTNVFSATFAEVLGLRGALGMFDWTIGPIAFESTGVLIGQKTLVHLPVVVAIIIVAFLLFLTFVNFWGIRESMWTNLLCTAVEVGGLLFVVIVGLRYWGSIDYFETPPAPDGTATALGPTMLFSGAVLTFFAFVGFEDMLNVSEEVKRPERTMPWGIIFAVVIATILYIAVAVTSVSVVHYTELAKAPAPLAAITEVAATWLPPWVFKVVTMFAVANTVLINYIMGSRLLYGMARQGLVPAPLGRVHEWRRTPHLAILTLLVVVLILAFASGVTQLATATGLLLLFCFAIVNGALIVLKLRRGEPRGAFEVPIFVPALGIVVNLSLIVARLIDQARITRESPERSGLSAPVLAGLLVLGISALYFTMRPKTITEETLAEVEEES
ncbi:MAG TPA: APC family permease [Tepidisphaeraceae bacterium]|nr:APC family permease [Tepidisphaeraceae bacterium]